MSRKTIFLIGAPSRRLHWDDVDLIETAVAPFTLDKASIGSDTVKWRVLEGQADNAASAQDTLFLNTVDLQSKSPGNVLLSHFYEHSISIRETHYLSDSSHDETTISLNDSNTDEGMDSAANCSNDVNLGPLEQIYDLKNIPNTAYLRSIVPQTPSVTLVVAVLGINPPRRVTTRCSNQQFDILELVVGDETKTGFGVTFWLPVTDGRKKAMAESNESFRKNLRGLRPRDIVLLRNVGLSFFQDRVYGQSLRKGMTKLDLLHRQPLDLMDSGGIYSATMITTATKENKLLYKVQKVRDWMMNFVGMKTRSHDSIAGGRPLPPDTQ